MLPIPDMVFGRPHSVHVRPPQIQVTVSQSLSNCWLLKGASESNGSVSLRSRLRRDRGVSAKLRGVRIVMPCAAASNPTYHVNPPPHHAQRARVPHRPSPLSLLYVTDSRYLHRG